jgi:hypothetical protein
MEKGLQSIAAEPPDGRRDRRRDWTIQDELAIYAADWLLPERHQSWTRANVAGSASPLSLLVAGLVFAAITGFFVIVRL